MAQKIHETGKYIYSDTDSIHAIGAIPDFIPLDNAKLGFWKHEFNIRYCKYLRQNVMLIMEQNLTVIS